MRFSKAFSAFFIPTPETMIEELVDMFPELINRGKLRVALDMADVVEDGIADD